MKQAVLFILIVLTLGGCSASGPLYHKAPPPQPGQALVYVYRTQNSALSGRTFSIYVDGKLLVDLHNNEYFFTYISAGSHSIKQTWPFDLDPLRLKSSELPLEAEAGRTYYFGLYSTVRTSDFQYVGAFHQVPPNKGQVDVAQCRLK